MHAVPTISWNICRETATSAIWKVTWRQGPTTSISIASCRFRARFAVAEAIPTRDSGLEYAGNPANVAKVRQSAFYNLVAFEAEA
jgi:hypothetical protein